MTGAGDKTNEYVKQGYESRRHHLECLAADTRIDMGTVIALASLYGPSEDFDGLVTALEDMEAVYA